MGTPLHKGTELSVHVPVKLLTCFPIFCFIGLDLGVNPDKMCKFYSFSLPFRLLVLYLRYNYAYFKFNLSL